MIIQKSLKLNTSKNFEIIDITSKINDLIDIDNGIISIFSRYSTTAIVVNENESGLLSDLSSCLRIWYRISSPMSMTELTITHIHI